MNHFTDTNLHSGIKKAITELGFEKPTPIQVKTIPHLLSSKQDVIASAETGTGKTAAFGLPSIHLTQIENKMPQTLVLCPTRELCIQIARDLTNYSKYIKGINIVAVYGGASIDTQIKKLKSGAHIVIGTPGRTKDLIRRRKLDISKVERLILDEADEMLSMGFKEDLDDILSKTPQEKQTLLRVPIPRSQSWDAEEFPVCVTMSLAVLNVLPKPSALVFPTFPSNKSPRNSLSRFPAVLPTIWTLRTRVPQFLVLHPETQTCLIVRPAVPLRAGAKSASRCRSITITFLPPKFTGTC